MDLHHHFCPYFYLLRSGSDDCRSKEKIVSPDKGDKAIGVILRR